MNKENNWIRVINCTQDMLTYPCAVRIVDSCGVCIRFLLSAEKFKSISGVVTHWMPIIDPVPVKKKCWLEDQVEWAKYFQQPEDYIKGYREASKGLAVELSKKLWGQRNLSCDRVVEVLKELIGEK
jgi:hypothetical protein